MKIGFIDYYLDEWHANNYPQWIREKSNGKCEVTYAYAVIDGPDGKKTTEEWCKEFGIIRCESIEEIVEKSDAIVVLSPDNCEMHEQLCQLPLRSKKPVYVDKTFAPDYATAKRIFKIAEESGTPCYSTSALRYADEYKDIDSKRVNGVSLWGPNDFETYSIHQLEPLVMLMNEPAKRVMMVKGKDWHTLTVEFESGRYGTVTQLVKGCPFVSNIAYEDENITVKIESDFFGNFIEKLVEFFLDGAVKVPHEHTLTVMALREAGAKAMQNNGEWLSLSDLLSEE